MNLIIKVSLVLIEFLVKGNAWLEVSSFCLWTCSVIAVAPPTALAALVATFPLCSETDEAAAGSSARSEPGLIPSANRTDLTAFGWDSVSVFASSRRFTKIKRGKV